MPPPVERVSLNGHDAEPPGPDLVDVRGQERARRALELAAAGGHNLLLGGPPGTGKTMLARRLPGILPRLPPRRGARGHEDPLRRRAAPARPAAGELAAVSRAAPHGLGLGDRRRRPARLVPARRASRTTVSCSWTSWPSSLGNALEALRQPLEDGAISIARVGGKVVFPARFQLVGTMNLCPCGARGDPAAECSCSAARLAAYRDKLSRALLDRFDLVVTVPRPRARELESGPAEGSEAVRERVDGGAGTGGAGPAAEAHHGGE